MEALIHLRQGYTDVLIRICPLLRRSGNKSEIFAFPRAKRISLVPQERISVPARGPPRFARGKLHQRNGFPSLTCNLQRFCATLTWIKSKRESLCDSLLLLVRARGLESRRCDAKPSFWFRLCYAPRSVAALTPHRGVIHYRSPSSPFVQIRTKKQTRHSVSVFLVRVKGLEPSPRNPD